MDEKKQVRLVSEKLLPHKTFRLKMGTMDKTNPLVVYVEGKVCISPNEEKVTYKGDIRDFKFSLKKGIRENLCETKYFQPNYICEFQIADSGIKVNKKSFLSFEFLLTQPSNNVLKLNDVRKHTEANIYKTVDLLEENILAHNFSLSKTKK